MDHAPMPVRKILNFQSQFHVRCPPPPACPCPRLLPPLRLTGIRPQLIVDLMQTGQPPFAAFKYNMSWAEALVQQGQDEAVTFMQTGKCRADAITLCPKDANVKKNQCNK